MTTELEVYEAHEAAPVTLFQTNDPAEVVEAAARAAQPLADVINAKHLYQRMGTDKNGKPRNHVTVEGWTLLGSMLGVFAVLDGEPEHVEIDGVKGWRATVKAVTRDGAVVGRASAMCLRSEANWRGRDEYALASMAQTRATSKALRQPLGFVMSLAGFEATPSEELDGKIDDAEVVTDPTGERLPADVEQVVYHPPDDERNPFHDDPDIGFGEPAPTAEGNDRGKQIFALYKALEAKDARFTTKYLKDQLEASYGTRDDRKLTQEQAVAWVAHLKELEAVET